MLTYNEINHLIEERKKYLEGYIRINATQTQFLPVRFPLIVESDNKYYKGVKNYDNRFFSRIDYQEGRMWLQLYDSFLSVDSGWVEYSKDTIFYVDPEEYKQAFNDFRKRTKLICKEYL